jgi:hypothetical protein
MNKRNILNGLLVTIFLIFFQHINAGKYDVIFEKMLPAYFGTEVTTKSVLDSVKKNEAPLIVQKFVREKLAEHGVSNADLIAVILDDSTAYFSVACDEIFISSGVAQLLERVLIGMHEVHEKRSDEYIQVTENFIALCSIALAHEASHLKNSDAYYHYRFNRIIDGLWFGVVYEAFFFVLYSESNGYLSESKTLLPKIAAWCATTVVGSIVGSLYLKPIAEGVYCRRYESRADEYACQNAENRRQLEQFYMKFKEYASYLEQEYYEKYPYLRRCSKKIQRYIFRVFNCFSGRHHPCDFDRSAMIKKYIQKWDDEHQE